MKKAFQRIIPFLTAVILSLCLALPASAYDVDYGKVSISIANAPEGTAYVDFLVRKKDIPKAHAKKQDYKIQKKISYYTGTGERINNTSSKGGYTIDEELLGRMEKDCWIDSESEIAQYNDDGYVSLLSHTDLVKEYIAYKKYLNDNLVADSCTMYLSGYDSYRIESSGYCYGVDLNYLEDKFGKIKAAYVDENGHILGVTSAYKSDRGNQWGISVSGDKLTLTLDDHWHNMYWDLFIKLGLPALLFIACAVIFIKWIYQGTRGSK